MGEIHSFLTNAEIGVLDAAIWRLERAAANLASERQEGYVTGDACVPAEDAVSVTLEELADLRDGVRQRAIALARLRHPSHPGSGPLRVV